MKGFRLIPVKRIGKILLSVVLVLSILATSMIVAGADSFYTIRINYLFADGTPAHDPYIATYTSGSEINDLVVTNPTVNGFAPMTLKDPPEGTDPYDPALLLGDTPATYGDSCPTMTFNYPSLNENVTRTVYYVPDMTHYAARYYLQNIYDDLYTLDRDRTEANKNRLGKTGTAPTDLESEEITGFTSLFHEPDAIAADGLTVFRVYYDRNYYSITFNLGEGGYGVEPVYAKYGTVIRIAEPSRIGYSFVGWLRTSADSSDNTYNAAGGDGTWHYLNRAGEAIDDSIASYLDANGEVLDDHISDIVSYTFRFAEGETVPAENTYYKAIWAPSTTHFNVVYWIENADSPLDDHSFDGLSDAETHELISANYSALAVREVYNIYDASSNSLVPVTPGTVITPDTRIRTRQQRYNEYKGSKAAKDYTQLKDFFSFNLNYADSTKTPVLDEEDGVVYMFDSKGNVIDFNTISKGTSEDLTGAGDFFEMITSENTDVPLLATDPEVTVRGDGTSRLNIFFRRKTFTLKFYYARQGYTNGALDPDKISLTNSTKAFNNNTNEKEYLKTTSKNVLEAIAMGSWKPNLADSLPTVKDEYKQRVTEGYDDFTDAHYGGYYRYYYYQWQAKYNESLTNKWLIDALNPVHRKNADAKEICYPGSIATEFYNKYYQDRKSTGNYTVKGIYEKLDKGLLFTDSARTTMKQNNIDYTELHFLISWTNSSDTDAWNNSITRVLHFRYENYVELLPREVEIVNTSGEQALLAEGNYTDVRQFTAQVDDNGSWVTKTRWYGLTTDHIYETIDSGNQYGYKSNPSQRSSNNEAVYKNQTPTSMTGFQLEPKDPASTTTYPLDQYNTEIDWSADTQNYRRCIIKFFYQRKVYTLNYYNGNGVDEDHTKSVMYGAPFNSAYHISEGEHLAGQYRYYWPDPEYYIESLRGYYSFEGWYNDPRFESPFDLATQKMPADDNVLYAKWVPKKINVIFYDNYDKYYIDYKIEPNDALRITLNPRAVAEDEADPVTSISVDYGSYTPLGYIPVNDDSPDNPRPKLKTIAEGASFAGWYYIRNRVPMRFEPENVPVTTLNEESGGESATLRLFAEWVTKDVAQYRIRYVRADDPTVDVAKPTTGRAYVWKTKTFDAKSGADLYDAYKWTSEGETAGTNWWPTTNSHSIVVKSNSTDENSTEYSPNEFSFTYIQKDSVYYKIQYLDSATRKPLRNEEVIESSHASVKAEARVIPSYIPESASASLVLTASTLSDPDAARAEELENNVITFLYTKNEGELLYEVEYLTQDLTGARDTYSVFSTETLTVTKASEGDTTVAVGSLFTRPIPSYLTANGYTRKAGYCTYLVTDSGGVQDPTEISVADAGSVTVVDSDKKTIRIYYDRNSYPYVYQFIDHSAEKLYLQYLEDHKTDPNPAAGAPWNGVIYEVNNGANTGLTGETITFDTSVIEQDPLSNRTVPVKFTYRPESGAVSPDPTSGDQSFGYVRVTNPDGTLNGVTLTIQADDSGSGLNTVKVYYRRDIERVLTYEMICVNDSSDTDYYEDVYHTPKFGRLSVTMQTVFGYDDINSVTFFDTNEEKITVGGEEDYLHLHKYKFLGWYSTPTYNPDYPAENRLSEDKILTPTEIGGELPALDTKYYALVEQVKVKCDIMFYYVDVPVAEYKAAMDEDLSPGILKAIGNADDPTQDNRVYQTGEKAGRVVEFSNPTGFVNHAECAWHRTDGYSMSMKAIDDRAYKYEFVEWWTYNYDKDIGGKVLIRKDNWNNSGEWHADSLNQQVPRNTDNYFIAVYARKPITQLPYIINYTYQTRTQGDKTFVKTGVLTEDDLKGDSAKVTESDCFELTDEFILSNAPYESNHGERLEWTDAAENVEKTSVGGSTTTLDDDRIITNVTAVQTPQTVVAHYRTTPVAEYNEVTGAIGDNYKLNEGMTAIVAQDTYGDLPFSHWEVRKSSSESGPVIAKSYEQLFDLCLFDNYWITPVYRAPEESTSGPAVILTHLDYSRNRWTDEAGAVNSDGSTDLLYTDFEIAFEDGRNRIHLSDEYQVGVVFEQCEAVLAGDFVPDNDYAYLSDPGKLKNAIKNAIKKKVTSGRYSYDPDNLTLKRAIQLSYYDSANLTNHDRVNYAKSFRNGYTINASGEYEYTNKDCLIKVTAFLIKDNEVTLSNSMYICLRDIASKNSVVSNLDTSCDPVA